MKNVLCILWAAVFILYPTAAVASGLESKGIGARARGMGFAMVAVTDDWTAVFYNPAAAGMIPKSTCGFEYLFFTGSIDSSASLQNLPPAEANAAKSDFIDFIGDEPAAFNKKNIDSDIHFGALGCVFKRENYSYGIGLYGSGSGTAWEDAILSQTGDLVAAEVSFVNGSMNIPLLFSWRMRQDLALGITVGINWGLLEYTTRKERSGAVPYSYKSVQDTEGIGISTDLGLLWQARQDLALGLVLKLPYTFKKTGTTAATQTLASLNAKSDTTVYMRYPLRTSLGFAWQLSDTTLLASSATWLNWSDYNLKIDYDDNIPGVFDDYSGNPSNWQDTIVVNLGVERQISEIWRIRGGITYDQAPEPKESRILTGGQVVDAWLFSLGAGVALGETEVDFGYIYTYGPEVDGYIPGATYSMNLHELFIGFARRF